MENPDQAVETVLAGLRNATPPEGLEGRVLAAMQARVAAMPSKTGWGFNRFVLLRPVVVFPLGTALALMILFVVIAPWHHAGRPGRVIAPVQEIAAAALPQPMASTDNVTRDATHRGRRTKMSPPIAPDGRLQAVDVSASREAMEAATYPAPPMPLTEQEKLLLQVAHRRDPHNVAILNPAIQAKQEAVEVAQFEDFFKEQKIEVKNEPTEQR